MVVGKVVFEGAIDNVNRGVPNAGHTSSNGLSRCCVVCEYYAVGQVNTEVVIVVHIQHTAELLWNTDEVSVTVAYCPLEYMAPLPSLIAVLFINVVLITLTELFVPLI